MGQVTDLDLTLDALGFKKDTIAPMIAKIRWSHKQSCMYVYIFDYGFTLTMAHGHSKGIGSEKKLLKAITDELKRV